MPILPGVFDYFRFPLAVSGGRAIFLFAGYGPLSVFAVYCFPSYPLGEPFPAASLSLSLPFCPFSLFILQG